MTKTKRVQSISGCGGWIYSNDHTPFINNLKGVFDFHFEDEPSPKSEEIYHQVKKDLEYFLTSELVRRYRKYNPVFDENTTREPLEDFERKEMGQFDSIFDIKESYRIKIKFHLDDDLIFTDVVVKVDDLKTMRDILKDPKIGVPNSNVSKVEIDSFWVNVDDIKVKDWWYNNARFQDYTDEDTNIENQNRLINEGSERFCEFLSQSRVKSEEEIQKKESRDQKEKLLFSPELVKNLPFEDKIERLREFLEFLKDECYFSKRHEKYNCPYFWIKDSSKEVIWEKDLTVFWERVREESRRYLFPNWLEEMNLEEKSKGKGFG